MRHLKVLLLLAVSALAMAGPVRLVVGTRFEFTNCASGGSSAQTITEGTYLFRVTDADVWLCLAASSATCASGGDVFPVGTVIRMAIPRGGQSAACRSTASNGDLTFTRDDG